MLIIILIEYNTNYWEFNWLTIAQGFVKRMLMGSTSKYLVEHAPCTVQVVKTDMTTEEEFEAKELLLTPEHQRKHAAPVDQLPEVEWYSEGERDNDDMSFLVQAEIP